MKLFMHSKGTKYEYTKMNICLDEIASGSEKSTLMNILGSWIRRLPVNIFRWKSCEQSSDNALCSTNKRLDLFSKRLILFRV